MSEFDNCPFRYQCDFVDEHCINAYRYGCFDEFVPSQGCPIGLECIRDADSDCCNFDACQGWAEPVKLPYIRHLGEDRNRLIVSFHRDAFHQIHDKGLKIYPYADLSPEWATAWGCIAWEYPFSKIEILSDGCLSRRIIYYCSLELESVGFKEPARLPYSYNLEKRSLIVHWNLPEAGFEQAVDADEEIANIPW